MIDAARPMAGAVFRPTGSSMMSTRHSLWYGLSCRALSSAWRVLVTTRMRFGLSGRTRSTVRWSIDLPPSTDISCFGFFFRERGQNRVPEPPARITAYIIPSLVSGEQQLHRDFKGLSADLALKGGNI